MTCRRDKKKGAYYMNFRVFAVAAFLSLPVSAQALVTFQAGQIAKAEDFNSNFSDLDERLKTVEGGSGAVTAQVNGVSMQVRNFSPGYYSVTTPTGVVITVDEEGYPTGTNLYYASSDCSGTPYIREVSLDSSRNIGESYTNPNFAPGPDVAYDGTNVYYSTPDSFVKLHSQSYYNVFSRNCVSASSTDIAHQAYPNDPELTGVSAFPLVITGAGTPITISAEIGDASATGRRIVYANGVRIGEASYIPSSASVYISVRLDSYPEQTVTLYKDGSYTGLSVGQPKTFYFVTSDCTGNAYVEVLTDYDRKWWAGSESISGPVFNNGNYYTLSSEIYKMSTGYQSYRSSNSQTCYTGTDSVKYGYKKATLTTQPSTPVFELPITVEGWVEETNYYTLPEAQ